MYFITCFSNAVVEKIGKGIHSQPSKSLGSAGMKNEKDFTKQRNPSGQDAGAILLWGDRSSA